MGSYLSRLFPLLFALFVAKKNKKKIDFFIVSIIFILVDVLIFLSGERVAFVLLNLSTIFIIVLISQYKILRLVTFLISILIVSFLITNNSNLYKRYVQNPAESMGL